MRHGRKKRAANYAEWWRENSFLLADRAANRRLLRGRP
jgi:hypothetical protein